ncbi:hypothetical protein O7606_10490 [Micromonospora sp. WMMD882]|uniref:hypothetical protein n=1 Tax=Micromonospora sp. WMMD882 TaxID=3015151 RepID=UPI00248D2BE3|nr:hypothetical protein [Micromonospora sp. WMMD882]WBB81744.1 hypothetical protein O7606_10490 [Micromonospora sp. WMMD882]
MARRRRLAPAAWTARVPPIVWLAVAATLVAVALSTRWRALGGDPVLTGSMEQQVGAVGPAAAGWLTGSATLLVLTQAAALAAGRAQQRLRQAGTAFAAVLTVALGALAVTLTGTVEGPFDDERTLVSSQPGPALLAAAGALLACLVGIWSAPTRPASGDAGRAHTLGGGTFGGGTPGRSARWRRLGVLLLAVGWATVAVAVLLPAWRREYPNRVEVDTSLDLAFVTAPVALVGALLAVPSLLRVGSARRPWREASRGWSIATTLGCGSSTLVVWYFVANDPYRQEDGMTSARPGAGTALALLGCVLVAVAGALPDDR